MLMLFGEYRVKLDGKGRMRVPSSILEQLSMDLKTVTEREERDDVDRILYVGPGFEGTLRMYTEEMMQDYLAEWQNFKPSNPEQREQLRKAHIGIRRLKMDSADRITLPKDVVERFSRIQSEEVVVYAYSGLVELWDAKQFDEKFNAVSEEDISNIHQQRDEMNEEL